jgi:hypothetical protein
MATGDWVALWIGLAGIALAMIALVARPSLRRPLWIACFLSIAAAILVAVFAPADAEPAQEEPAAMPPISPPQSTLTPTSLPILETEMRQLNVVNYDGTLRDGYNADQIVSGNCGGTSSLIYDNPNIYRCYFEDATGSYVSDPCFSFADGISVFCVGDPWSQTGTQIDLEEPVSYSPSFNSLCSGGEYDSQWAMEVVDPRHSEQPWHCKMNSGANSTIAGNTATYSCDRADRSGVGSALNTIIMGEGPVWKVLFYDPEETELVEAAVSKVWN